MTQTLNFGSTATQYHSPFQLVPSAKHDSFSVLIMMLSCQFLISIAECLDIVYRRPRAFLEFFGWVVQVFLASTLNMAEGSVETEVSVFESMTTPVRL